MVRNVKQHLLFIDSTYISLLFKKIMFCCPGGEAPNPTGILSLYLLYSLSIKVQKRNGIAR